MFRTPTAAILPAWGRNEGPVDATNNLEHDHGAMRRPSTLSLSFAMTGIRDTPLPYGRLSDRNRRHQAGWTVPSNQGGQRDQGRSDSFCRRR